MTQVCEQGVTVLPAEQEVHAAGSIADRGYMLKAGEIVREETVDALRNARRRELTC